MPLTSEDSLHPEPVTELNTPTLSIIVVVYNMPRQAMNTLYSLSAAYQRDVDASEYEVMVVENSSNANLDAEKVAALGENFHYRLRQESGMSPAAAINDAVGQCRGKYLGILIDGARMLTPRVVRYALQALKIPGSIVAVPGYYLTEQGNTEGDPGQILEHEEGVLQQLEWRENGYGLFRHACFSNGNRHGYLDPIMECTALFCELELFRDIGGADQRFDLKGGGALNLHLYRQLTTTAGTELFVLPGEGNFHQFHGGTSTTAGTERDELVKRFKQQLDSFWPGGFKSVSREPLLYGAVTAEALKFLQSSSDSAASRFRRFADNSNSPWQDDTAMDSPQ